MGKVKIKWHKNKDWVWGWSPDIDDEKEIETLFREGFWAITYSPKFEIFQKQVIIKLISDGGKQRNVIRVWDNDFFNILYDLGNYQGYYDGLIELPDYQAYLLLMEIRERYFQSPWDLGYLLFNGQPKFPKRKLLAKKNRENVEKERAEERKRRENGRKGSNRILSSKRNTALVVYPSGRQLKAKVKINHGYAVIEPEKADTAYFIIDAKNFYEKEVINLRETEYLRVYHTRKGNDFIKSLLR